MNSQISPTWSRTPSGTGLLLLGIGLVRFLKHVSPPEAPFTKVCLPYDQIPGEAEVTVAEAKTELFTFADFQDETYRQLKFAGRVRAEADALSLLIERLLTWNYLTAERKYDSSYGQLPAWYSRVGMLESAVQIVQCARFDERITTGPPDELFAACHYDRADDNKGRNAWEYFELFASLMEDAYDGDDPIDLGVREMLAKETGLFRRWGNLLSLLDEVHRG